MPPADPPATERFRALVLAAGHGRRMGGPKALMSVAGEPWWRTQSRRLTDAGIDATWVVSPVVLTAMRGQPNAPLSLVVADPDAPMFNSIVAGVRALAEEGPGPFFLLPVDTASPAHRVWSALVGTDRPRIPSWLGNRGHPVFLPWSTAEDILRLASIPLQFNEAPRLDRIIAATAEVIDVDDPTICINLNTPSDVDRYLASAPLKIDPR